MKYVFYLIIAFYLILIFVKNTMIIQVDFIIKELNVSLFVVFLFSFAFGFITSFFLLYKRILHIKKELRESKNAAQINK